MVARPALPVKTSYTAAVTETRGRRRIDGLGLALLLLALLDLVMPGRDGAEVASGLRALIPGLPIAMLTGYTHSPLLAAARKAGVAVFTKPVVIHELAEFLDSQTRS